MEMDSLQAPLISNRDPDDRDDVLDDAVRASSPAGSGSGPGSGPAAHSSPGLFMWLLTFSAGISGLLFGCMHLVTPTHTRFCPILVYL